MDEGSRGRTTKEAPRQHSNTLLFGDIRLKREVHKRAPCLQCPEGLDGNLNGAVICEKEPVPAVCGIRAIWVTSSNRRKHIASHLLDAAR